jgi:hypothetical protein
MATCTKHNKPKLRELAALIGVEGQLCAACVEEFAKRQPAYYTLSTLIGCGVGKARYAPLPS